MEEDINTLRRLMNDLEFENKQYEIEIEKEILMFADYESKTETAEQETTLNKETTKQHDDEAKLMSTHCIQNIQNCKSLQEGYDILYEQEKNLSKNLTELKKKHQSDREKRKGVVDRYSAIYSSYLEKYQKIPLAVQLMQKEDELRVLEQSHSCIQQQIDEAEKKLQRMETSSSQNASANEFPIYRNQTEFIIRLAQLKVTYDKLVVELARKTKYFAQLRRFIEEKKNIKQQLAAAKEEKSKQEIEKRNFDKPASSEGERREKAKNSEGSKNVEDKEWREERKRTKELQNIELQLTESRCESRSALSSNASSCCSMFNSRLPPKILLPARNTLIKFQMPASLGQPRHPEPLLAITTCLKKDSVVDTVDPPQAMETEDANLPAKFSDLYVQQLGKVIQKDKLGFDQNQDERPAEEKNSGLTAYSKELEQENTINSAVIEMPPSAGQLDYGCTMEVDTPTANISSMETLSLDSVSAVSSSCAAVQLHKTSGSGGREESGMGLDAVSHNSDIPRSHTNSFRPFLISSSAHPRDCSSVDNVLSLNYSSRIVSEVCDATTCSDYQSAASVSDNVASVAASAAKPCILSSEAQSTFSSDEHEPKTDATDTTCPEFCTMEVEEGCTNIEAFKRDSVKNVEEEPTTDVATEAALEVYAGRSSPVTSFSFEEEMAKLKKLTESPSVNLYSGRPMFDRTEQRASTEENSQIDGLSVSMFMGSFGQFESTNSTKGSDKPASKDFSFSNSFTYNSNAKKWDPSEAFCIIGNGGGTDVDNSHSKGRGEYDTPDRILQMFGGSGGGDADNGLPRNESRDIFKTFDIGDSNKDSSKKKGNDFGGEFLKFGEKSPEKIPVKSQFKYF